MTLRPNFAIIGAPRCGTTSLTRWLEQHPEVYITNPKEPFHFADHYPGLRKLQGIESRAEYQALFRHAGPRHRAVGEASTLYLSSPGAVEQFLEFADDEPTFIVLVRDPAELAQSFHSQMLLQGFDRRPFADAWTSRAQPKLVGPTRNCPDKNLLRYDQIARVGTQLKALLDTVERSQLEIIVFDDLRDHPHETLNTVTRRLGLGLDTIPSNLGAHNSSRLARGPIPALLRRRRVRRVTSSLKRSLPAPAVAAIRGARDQLLYRTYERKDLPDTINASLRDVFRSEVRLLDELLMSDLFSKWGY